MDLLYDIALSFLNIPYVWGGKNPVQGLDCSGLTQCILSSVGLGPIGITTAQGIHDYFLKQGGVRSDPKLGSLAFFGDIQRIHHVGFCLDSLRMIESAHGDQTITNKAVAALKGAYVKVSPINRLPDLFAIIMPDYRPVGL